MGAALGTLVVTVLLDASWPVRIGVVLLALVLVGGYLFLQGRRHDAAGPPTAEPSAAAETLSATPAGPSTPAPPSIAATPTTATTATTATTPTTPAAPAAPATEDTP